MFFSVIVLGMLLIFVYVWGDYMKVLIFLELLGLLVVVVLMWGMSVEYFSLNYFLSCLIFLVCESSLGFLLFILYISMESELVKKMNLVQF